MRLFRPMSWAAPMVQTARLPWLGPMRLGPMMYRKFLVLPLALVEALQPHFQAGVPVVVAKTTARLMEDLVHLL